MRFPEPQPQLCQGSYTTVPRKSWGHALTVLLKQHERNSKIPQIYHQTTRDVPGKRYESATDVPH